jgi:pimeloyl-ACP methyl ester carboxylesterase
MAELTRPDGASIHYQLQGEGPLIAMASYWAWNPDVYTELLADLATDHRVLTYDLRGVGRSTRRGPYDMETDSADLEALLDEVGGARALLAVADSANRGARLAVRRQDLAPLLICLGTAPIGRAALRGGEGMIASDSVVDAFVEMISRDYRGALRTLLTATNEQMSETELQERVARQAAYSPQEAATARIRAWMGDEPDQYAKRLGSRLWLITSVRGVAGPWLPDPERLRQLRKELTPEAQAIELEAGPTSQPDEVAAEIRGIVGAH